ncbi:hypothetical protein [Ewingella americana]|uniref:hypothetical protein n=1 Tax=Ewingella americana TaxID=41202 RepID=UPI003B969A1C
MVVILVVLTETEFRFSLFISQLMAKAIPVRGAKLEKPDALQHLVFCFLWFGYPFLTSTLFYENPV